LTWIAAGWPRVSPVSSAARSSSSVLLVPSIAELLIASRRIRIRLTSQRSPNSVVSVSSRTKALLAA